MRYNQQPSWPFRHQRQQNAMTIEHTKTDETLIVSIESRISIFEIKQLYDLLISESIECNAITIVLSDSAKVDVAAIQLFMKFTQWFQQQGIAFSVSHNNETLANKLSIMQLQLTNGHPDLAEAPCE